MRTLLLFSHVHAQRDIFKVRRSFLELGHFDKHFLENTCKKGPLGKIVEFFLLDFVKPISRVKNLTQRWIQLGPFSSKLGHFFDLQKGAREGSSLLPR